MLTRTLLRNSPRLTSSARPLNSTITHRALSTTPLRSAAAGSHDAHNEAAHHDHAHESPYDQPGGWLWGIPPGEKRKREGWEWPLFGIYCPSLVIAVVIYAMKEDTSIQTWALEEARRRLEKEGILEDTNPE